jgi:hypothetical protein
MTARIGDEIMVMPRELHEQVREGQIREVRNDPMASSISCNGLTPVTRACCRTVRTW